MQGFFELIWRLLVTKEISHLVESRVVPCCSSCRYLILLQFFSSLSKFAENMCKMMVFFFFCSSQEIWNEVGESDEERDRMLLQLDQDCLSVYQRKVDQASKSRADLLQSLADSNIELGNLISALGEGADVGKVSQIS